MRAASRGRHFSGSAWSRRWLLIGVACALALAGGGVAVAVVSSGPSAAEIAAAKQAAAERQQAIETAARQAQTARLLAGITILPASGAADVAPDTAVTVTASSGAISNVVLAGGSTPANGTLDGSRQTWTYSGGLQAAASYTVTATVTGPQGVSVQKTASFSTLKPVGTVNLTLFPYGGMTVGVGQPLVVHFSHAITSLAARQSVYSHFTITESTPVAGGWHWFSPTELHFRPQSYWPTGEQVSVSSDLDGWNVGEGRWGKGVVSVNFVIGDSHVSVADLASHKMTVYNNGTVVATYPMSGGRDQYPTMNGFHLVLDKENVVHMVSSTVGIPVDSPNGYDEYVYNDVHISDSGEYVHDAPWSVGSQGVANVSHGCINLGPNDSLAFYNFSRVGDVVQVIGGPRPAVPGDHGVMDWTSDWSQWVPGTVQPAPTPPSTTTTAPQSQAPVTTTSSTAPSSTTVP